MGLTTALQDSSRAAICGCMVFAAVAGLFGAGLLLGSAKGLAGGEASRYIALAALTVVSSTSPTSLWSSG